MCGLDNCKLFSHSLETQFGQLAASSPCTFGRKIGEEELLVSKTSLNEVRTPKIRRAEMGRRERERWWQEGGRQIEKVF